MSLFPWSRAFVSRESIILMMPTSGARPLPSHYSTSFCARRSLVAGTVSPFTCDCHQTHDLNDVTIAVIPSRTSISPILCALDVPLNEKVWHDLKFIRFFVKNIPKRVEKWQTMLTKPVLRRVYLCVNVNTLRVWPDVIYWCVCTDM